MQLNDLRSAPGARREKHRRAVASVAVWVRLVAVATKVKPPAPVVPSLRASRVVSSRCTAVCRSSASSP